MPKHLTPEEEFEQAFAEATGGTPADDEQDNTATEAEQTSVSTEEDIPRPGETEEADPTPGEQDSGDSDDSGGGDGETDWKTLYEKEKQRTSSWEGRIKAANKRAEDAEKRIVELEATKQTPPAKELPPPEEPASEDDPELKSFFEEFPELEKPFNKLVERKGAAIARKIVQEEIAKIKPDIESITANQQASADQVHFDTITKAHPDWKSYVDNGELMEWIEQQPSILRKSYTEVAQKGRASEVIELFDAFKNSKSPTPPPPSSRSKKAQDAEAVPASHGGPPPGGPDLNDFDSAWNEAISKKGK